MNELSLFTGAGGGVLGSKLLGHRIIGYVENNDYRQRVIAQRIKDGIFDEAPVFGDIRALNREGYAEIYSGLVDIVSGGFPCQDLSCAGKGAGLNGEKSGLWFEMAATVRIVRPRYVFIENVPALLVRGFDRVLGSLFEMGYDAAWGIVSAADVGAPHLRKRLWILGYSNGERWKARRKNYGKHDRSKPCSDGEHTFSVADTDKKRCEKQRKPKSDGTKQPRPQLPGCEMVDTQKQSIRSGLCKDEQAEVWRGRSGDGGCSVSNTDKTDGETCRSDKMGIGKSERKKNSPSCGNWWSTERGLDRVAYGTPDRSNRLAAIGDGQVPTVAAFAFEYLRAVIERQ